MRLRKTRRHRERDGRKRDETEHRVVKERPI